MSEELLKMYAQLTQEVSLCQDEDIRALGKGILELAKNYDNSLKENEKLHSIIKEVREKIESVQMLGLRSGKTLIATLLNDILEILDKENK